MESQVSVSDLLTRAWHNYTDKFPIYIFNTLLLFVTFILFPLFTLGLGIVCLPALEGGYLKSVLDLSRGGDVPIGRFIKSGFRRFFPLLGLTCVIWFVRILIGLVALWPIPAMLFTRAPMGTMFGGVIYYVIASIFVVVLWFYLSIIWTFSQFFVVDKDRGIFQAMRSSRDMVRGNFWEVVLMWILTGVTKGLAFFSILGLLFVIPYNDALFAQFYLQRTE